MFDYCVVITQRSHRYASFFRLVLETIILRECIRNLLFVVLDTAARMCVRTGTSQLAGRITEMNLESTGQDLVITSQHMGSRPEHVPIQNRVFSFSGKSKKYPGLKEPLSKGGAGYGMPDGIKGPNCTHDIYPYWEGDYIPPDVEPNEQYYKNTQKQRAMERSIRATKREIEAQRAIGGDVTELRAKLKKQRAEYYAFSEKVGIRPKENRLRVVGGTSDLKKNKSLIPQQNLIDKVRYIRNSNNYQKELQKINIELDDICVKKSKWSGKIIVKNNLLGMGQKEWNCDISLAPNAGYADELHELLHARSISYYDEDTYRKFYNIEEGSVELLTEEICKRKKKEFLQTYEEQVKHLRRINRRAKLYANEYDFAKDLINVELPDRVEWLINKIHVNYLKGILTESEIEGIWDSFRYLVEECIE